MDGVCNQVCVDLKLEKGRGTGGAKMSSPSLDHIEPEKGYVRGNVWVISYRANMIKNNATIDELQLLATNLAGKLLFK